jgi:hypothetical protein
MKTSLRAATIAAVAAVVGAASACSFNANDIQCSSTANCAIGWHCVAGTCQQGNDPEHGGMDVPTADALTGRESFTAEASPLDIASLDRAATDAGATDLAATDRPVSESPAADMSSADMMPVVDAMPADMNLRPPPVTDLTITAPNRGTVTLTWTAPTPTWGALAAYDARRSNAPIDDTNFSAATSLATPLPAAAGTKQSITLTGLPLGQAVYFAIRVIDNYSQSSPTDLATPTPFVPGWVGQVELPDTSGTNGHTINFGSGGPENDIATGDFNGDSHPDLAVGGAQFGYIASDPFDGTVQLYFGTGSGLPTTPNVVIRGTNSQIGTSVGAGDFNGDGVTDLFTNYDPSGTGGS